MARGPNLHDRNLVNYSTNEDGYFDDTVLCPNCKGGYLHQGAVFVYERASEDAKDITRISISENGTCVSTEKIPDKDSGNPSARRNGIKIQFWCEGCGDLNQMLCIYQHKGATFIEWN